MWFLFGKYIKRWYIKSINKSRCFNLGYCEDCKCDFNQMALTNKTCLQLCKLDFNTQVFIPTEKVEGIVFTDVIYNDIKFSKTSYYKDTDLNIIIKNNELDIKSQILKLYK